MKLLRLDLKKKLLLDIIYLLSTYLQQSTIVVSLLTSNNISNSAVSTYDTDK